MRESTVATTKTTELLKATSQGLQPLKAQKLYLNAAERVAEAIFKGQWKPGDKLPSERDLALALEVSRSTIRQSLAALEALSVIRIKQGVGAFVLEGALEMIASELVAEMVTEGDPLMLVEARRTIEPGVALLAALNRTDEDLSKLEKILHEMEWNQHEAVNEKGFVNADIKYHFAIAIASHNPILHTYLEDLTERMQHRVWLTAAWPIVRKRARQYQDQHNQLFEAIKNKDAQDAQRIMSRHLSLVTDNLKSYSLISQEDDGGNDDRLE